MCGLLLVRLQWQGASVENNGPELVSSFWIERDYPTESCNNNKKCTKNFRWGCTPPGTTSCIPLRYSEEKKGHGPTARARSRQERRDELLSILFCPTSSCAYQKVSMLDKNAWQSSVQAEYNLVSATTWRHVEHLRLCIDPYCTPIAHDFTLLVPFIVVCWNHDRET